MYIWVYSIHNIDYSARYQQKFSEYNITLVYHRFPIYYNIMSYVKICLDL